MKAKLIILDNPIVVTDEEIKKGDNVIFLQNKIRYKVEYISQCNDFNNDLDCKKEISFNKPIDYNGIDFGIVDVEKLANAVMPIKTFDIEIEETSTNIKIIKKL